MIKSYISDIFFPTKRCSFCGQNVNSSHFTNPNNYFLQRLNKMNSICISCKEQLLFPLMPFCSYCHKPLKDKTNDICNDCKNLPHRSFIFNRSAILYNDFAKDLIALYKYRAKQSLAKEFSYLLAIAYDYYFKEIKIDYITYVPVHNNRLQERGFNQAELLCVEFKKLIGVPLIDCLERIKDTDKQSKQGKKERFRQIEDSFMVKENIGTQIEHKNILLIDDIYTTGATIIECANVLKLAKANYVYSITLSRAYDI